MGITQSLDQCSTRIITRVWRRHDNHINHINHINHRKRRRGDNASNSKATSPPPPSSTTTTTTTTRQDTIRHINNAISSKHRRVPVGNRDKSDEEGQDPPGCYLITVPVVFSPRYLRGVKKDAEANEKRSLDCWKPFILNSTPTCGSGWGLELMHDECFGRVHVACVVPQ